MLANHGGQISPELFASHETRPIRLDGIWVIVEHAFITTPASEMPSVRGMDGVRKGGCVQSVIRILFCVGETGSDLWTRFDNRDRQRLASLAYQLHGEAAAAVATTDDDDAS